ncbi:UNKNOWN [Stylonychia lemnae]|uniref:Uncharacterized protein n=1 Tax=Stylonychia lemnae TaxID=5949 RepID=A0A078A1J1_STYLE|nr:UNKNOWN [Stylonychia lemnae]|eukprot:CDW75975.1 UNKNOWN [Stylonychia lemnae]
MFDHFERSMSRKSAYRVINKPDYLSHFKYKKDPEIEHTFIAIKNGEYDLDKEEVQLTKLMKDIRTKTSQQINRQLKQIGVLNYTPEKKRRFQSHYSDQDMIGEYKWFDTHHQESRNIRTFVVQDQKYLTHTNHLQQPQHTSFSTDFREKTNQPLSTRAKSKMSFMSTQRRDNRHDESIEQVIKSPFQNQLIRDIWDKSIAEELSTNATTHNVNQGIRYLRQEQEKLRENLEVIKLVQEGDNGISLMEASEQNQFLKDSNQRNFLDKQVIDQMKEENFKNSVFIRYLKGTTGGNNRLNLVWKPNKFTFTKIGPKIDETLYQQEK